MEFFNGDSKDREAIKDYKDKSNYIFIALIVIAAIVGIYFLGTKYLQLGIGNFPFTSRFRFSISLSKEVIFSICLSWLTLNESHNSLFWSLTFEISALKQSFSFCKLSIMFW